MLSPELAQKIVARIAPYIKNRMMITDCNGIVVASTLEDLLGLYNKDARNLLKSGLNVNYIEDSQSFPGCKAGIHIVFYLDGKPEGVIGMAGNAGEDLLRQANMIRLSLESMIEYESLKQKLALKESGKNRLMNMLLYDANINEPIAKSAACELGFDPELIRVPFLLIGRDQRILHEIYRQLESYKNQDISCLTRLGDVVTFKAVQNADECNREILQKKAAEWIEKWNIKVIVGVPQSMLRHYHSAFQALSWTRQYCKDTEPTFFSDYLVDYCLDRLPKEMKEMIFSELSERLDQRNKSIMTDTLRALFVNNININETAEAMGVHRNTIIFRLKKIKSALHLDPINNYNDQWILKGLVHYLSEN